MFNLCVSVNKLKKAVHLNNASRGTQNPSELKNAQSFEQHSDADSH